MNHSIHDQLFSVFNKCVSKLCPKSVGHFQMFPAPELAPGVDRLARGTSRHGLAPRSGWPDEADTSETATNGVSDAPVEIRWFRCLASKTKKQEGPMFMKNRYVC